MEKRERRKESESSVYWVGTSMEFIAKDSIHESVSSMEQHTFKIVNN